MIFGLKTKPYKRKRKVYLQDIVNLFLNELDLEILGGDKNNMLNRKISKILKELNMQPKKDSNGMYYIV